MSEYYDPQPPVDQSLKIPHLVFGLLFLGFAGLWALGESGAVSGEYVAVLGPAVLILAGIVGLVASLASSRNRRRRERRRLAERDTAGDYTTYDDLTSSHDDDTMRLEER
jgi:hypothetical protein